MSACSEGLSIFNFVFILRHETDERLHNMEQKLGSLWKLIKSGIRL